MEILLKGTLFEVFAVDTIVPLPNTAWRYDDNILLFDLAWIAVTGGGLVGSVVIVVVESPPIVSFCSGVIVLESVFCVGGCCGGKRAYGSEPGGNGKGWSSGIDLEVVLPVNNSSILGLWNVSVVVKRRVDVLVHLIERCKRDFLLLRETRRDDFDWFFDFCWKNVLVMMLGLFKHSNKLNYR